MLGGFPIHTIYQHNGMVYNIKCIAAIKCYQSNGAHEFNFTSAIASDTIRADITGDSPLLKPNCNDELSNDSE